MAKKDESEKFADDESPEGEEGEGKKKGLFGNKLVLIGIAVVLLLGSGGGGAYMMGMFDSGPEVSGDLTEDQLKALELADMTKDVSFITLEDVTVNLSAPQPPEPILKVKIDLEVANEDVKLAIEPLMSRVVDVFQVYLREMRVEDLRGSSGLFRLKEELLKRVNIAVAPNKVDAVLFREFIIQ